MSTVLIIESAWSKQLFLLAVSLFFCLFFSSLIYFYFFMVSFIADPKVKSQTVSSMCGTVTHKLLFILVHLYRGLIRY